MFVSKKDRENTQNKRPTGYIAAIAALSLALGVTSGMAIESHIDKNTEGGSKVVAERSYAEPVSYDLGEGELTNTEIAQKVGPAVVGIQCSVTMRSIFGTQRGTSSGSGIIISDSGNIVTNYHVIENASDITVILNTGEEIAATLVGGDDKTDLAVLKITTESPLTVATLGNSESVLPGDRVVAIGNPLGFTLFGTVTAGIISGIDRTLVVEGREMTLLQTDAAINSGNSGGALINAYGEVIGINSAGVSSSVSDGLGFAIPINEAVPIIKDLIEVGYVRGRPFIGVSVREITRSLAYYNNLTSDHGLYVMSVTEGSGAERAGIMRGDIILGVDGKDVTAQKDLEEVNSSHKAGDTITLVIDRDGEIISIPVTLSEDRS